MDVLAWFSGIMMKGYLDAVDRAEELDRRGIPSALAHADVKAFSDQVVQTNLERIRRGAKA